MKLRERLKKLATKVRISKAWDVTKRGGKATKRGTRKGLNRFGQWLVRKTSLKACDSIIMVETKDIIKTLEEHNKDWGVDHREESK